MTEEVQMPFAWKPLPGQVALIELGSGGNDCLTGVVVDDDTEQLVVDLGASPRPPAQPCEVVASFFAADALYRLRATLSAHGGEEGVIDLRVHDVERVQRRSAPRTQLRLPVVMSNFDDPAAAAPGQFSSVLGETIDVAESGCRVRVPRPFPHGCDPTVTLELPFGTPVVALAAVLQAESNPDGSFEYRLVFLEMDEVDRLRIAELVEEPVNA